MFATFDESDFKSTIHSFTGWWSTYGSGNIPHVGDDSLDSISFALNFGNETRHLVPKSQIFLFWFTNWLIRQDPSGIETSAMKEIRVLGEAWPSGQIIIGYLVQFRLIRC